MISIGRCRMKSFSKYTMISVIFCLVVSQPTPSESYSGYSLNDVYGVIKEVIKGAAEWGIEEAGVRVLGPSGWKLCKNIMTPVLTQLRSKFPLLFDSQFKGSQAAKDAASQAVNWIEKDNQLRTLIVERLNQLDKTHQEQLGLLVEIRKDTKRSLEIHQTLLKKIDSLEQQVSVIHKGMTINYKVAQSAQDWYAKAGSAKDVGDKVSYYTEAINHNQNRVNAYFNRGLAYFDQGDFNSAYLDFNRAIVLDASFARAYTNRGAASQRLGRYDEAIANYTTSIKYDATIAENYENLMAIYSSRKKYTEAYDNAKRWLQFARRDDRADMYGRLAWYALLNRDFQNAITYARTGVGIDSSAKWIYVNLAHGYLFTGQLKNANDIYLKYNGIKLSNRYWEQVILDDFEDLDSVGLSHPDIKGVKVTLYGNLSYHLLFERRFREASDYARGGLKLDPSVLWINTNLAHSYLFMNQVDKAAEIYNRYKGQSIEGKFWEEVILDDFEALKKGGINHAETSELSVTLYTSLSWHQLLKRQYRPCIEAANNAVKRKPKYLVPYTNLAHCYLLTGKYGAARDIYIRYKGYRIGNDLWESVIKDDFDILRKRGIFHADMDRISNELN